MKGIRVVVRPTVGADIVCIEGIIDSERKTIVCLGKRDNVKLPLGESLRRRIEASVKEKLEWSLIEGDISIRLSEF